MYTVAYRIHITIGISCFFPHNERSDIGTLDDRGYSKIESRLKDLIIRGGSNIYPAEVEHLIHTHPNVQEAQVSTSHFILKADPGFYFILF